MAGLIWSVVNALLLLVVASVIFWVFRRRHAHGLFRRHGIPGPDPELFWGNWKQLKRNRIEVFQEWIEQYGKVFGFFMAEKPCMVVTDLDLVRQIFVKEADTFTDRPQYVMDVEPFASSLSFLRGEEWKKVRTVLNPSITASKVNLCSGIVSGCVKDLLRVLKDRNQRDEVIDFIEVAEGYSLDVLTKSVLAWKVNCQRKSDDQLLLGVRKLFADLDKTAVESALAQPGIRTILKLLYPMTSFAKVVGRIADSVRDTVKNRRQGKVPRENDILQTMLDAQAGSNDETCNVRRSGLLIEDRHIISNSVILLAAGFQTTAAAIGFTLYLLATHPEEQERLSAEISAVLHPNDETSLEAIHSLRRLDMVIKESIRLYPSVPFLTSRTCPRDTTVKGQFIPAGTTVFAPAWHIHRNPEHWPEPSRFLPERFAEDNQERHPLAFAPFGLGPRHCFGKRLALLEIKMAVCEILRNYRLAPCKETVHPITVTVPNVLLRPVGGIKLKLEKRT